MVAGRLTVERQGTPNMKVLITGGAGFIGTEIVFRFLQLGADIVVVDDLSTGKYEKCHNKTKFYKVDCSSAEFEALVREERPRVVLHHAAQANVRASWLDPMEDVRRNVIGTIGVLRGCSAAGTKTLVFASSGGAVYGESAKLPLTEADPCYPISPYGADKLACEHHVRMWARENHASATILRYGNVYGLRQDPRFGAGIIGILARNMYRGEVTTIFGSGKQVRDYVHVSDVVAANQQLVEGGRPPGTYNIGTGVGTSVEGLCRMFEEAMPGRIAEWQHLPRNPYEVEQNILDISLAERHLDWHPTVSLASGIQEFVGDGRFAVE